MTVNVIGADNLKGKSIAHGFFTRCGGASQGIYQSLNCGIGSDDTAENIIENRRLAAGHLSGEACTPLLSCYQIHSNKAVTVTKPWREQDKPKADAMVTDKANIILSVLTADCAPVLFHDPKAHVIGAAHAGWQGALYGVIENTLQAMEDLGASRDAIYAAVGPCIGAKSYEVGDDFYEKFIAQNKSFAKYFWSGCDAAHHQFDLPRFVMAQLECSGVQSLWISDYDTYKSESLFYSYRRSCHKNEPDYGRQLSAIMLKT